MIVTLDHLTTVPWGRKRGFCLSGTRRLCDRHGIDLDTALAAGGIPEETLLATGNALCRRLVDHARRVEEEKGETEKEASHGH